MSVMNESIINDAFKYLRALPTDILSNLNAITVDRKGENDSAYMRLENIIGHVSPDIDLLLNEKRIYSST